MNDEYSKTEIKRLIQRVKRISSLPTVVTKVNELLDDPKSCAADFNKVVSEDQALTARLLKLVNSAFYGFPEKIDTISRAITIVGFRELRALVLTTSVMSLFNDLGDNISFRMEDYWKHNLACALASRILAIYKREQNPETYFVAGLLHDIGRLVLMESCPDKYGEVFTHVQEKNALMLDAEKDVFGFTHETVEKELASNWNLSQNIVYAVGFHHRRRGTLNSFNCIDIVHVSNILINACGIGSSGEKFVPRLKPDVWERIGLKKTILESSLEKIDEQLEVAISFLSPNKANID